VLKIMTAPHCNFHFQAKIEIPVRLLICSFALRPDFHTNS
jgi:hypothetical protein